METFRITILALVWLMHSSVTTAKTSPAVSPASDSKLRYTNKLNSVSTTPKTEFDFESIKFLQDQKAYNPSVYSQHLRPVSQPVQQQQVYQHPIPAQGQLQQVQLHPQAQQQLLQMIQRALSLSQQHQQPTAMIVIAQPGFLTTGPTTSVSSAPVPSNSIYSASAAVNSPVVTAPQNQAIYYSPNSQLRSHHQRVPQNEPFVPSQPVRQSPFQAQPVEETVQQRQQEPSTYVQYYPSQPELQQQSQPQSQRQSPAQQSQHLSQIAQAAAQQYGLQLGGQQPGAAPVESLPPIITGLENFSPEQQEKIRAQLSEHFGPLQPLAGSSALQTGSKSNPGNFKYTSSKYQPKTVSTDYESSQEIKGKM
ncbi:unnamed protein product [Callosobruchus maculatus]|uniref:Zasp-like motif domain-containing protein n=1 Tax=Callosobruchus maculatus TaxID=64391 RepID=A0A653DFL0_CALMS|nr:unnamed protein product [Callosobruchus maculatus]